MSRKAVWIILLASVFAIWQFSGCSKKSNTDQAKAAAAVPANPSKIAKTSTTGQTSSSEAVTSSKKSEKTSLDEATVNNLSDIIKKSMAELQIQSPTQKLEAMDFTATDLDGNQVKLSDFRGKVVFLNFWATWCPWCVKEMPSMQTLLTNLQKKYGNQFVILAVDAGESASQVKNWLKGKNLKFHFVLDPKSQVNGMYGVRGLPSTYIVKKNGEILGRAVGARDWSTEAAHNLFEALLKE
ncbi:MAG: TlpA family protein disulfide reductase [Calditrichaeota bacterium]|nr:TlpA family protein disulfide reductase [Calditrichota bacterium]